MPHPTTLIEVVPIALSTAPGRVARPARAWASRLSCWLRARADALDPSGRDRREFDSFADLLSQAREPDEVRVALVRLAGRISGASGVELLRARGGRNSPPLASWPDQPAPTLSGREWTEHRGRPRLSDLPERRNRPDCSDLWLDLRSAGEVRAILHLTKSDGRPWPARVIRRLETLCAMAASAERGLAAEGRGDGAGADPAEGVPSGEPTLGAFLAFSLAQARRRNEPLSLLTIEVDRFAAIRSLLGAGLADEAAARVARVVRDTLRASDVVTRLDGGRLAAILPAASTDDAARVAESLRAAIARAGLATEDMPTLTATIGVASYPDHANDVATLRSSASTALLGARVRGYDRVAAYEATSFAA